jgi:hypothetical protein
MDQFVKRDLFGGALVADLPQHFGDGSERRQVPDHQEVYVDFTGNGHTSATFDILEYVQRPGDNSDLEALKYHFDDILQSTEEPIVYQTDSAHLAKLPDATALTLLSVLQSKKKDGRHFRQFRRSDPDYYGILMTLVRLPHKATDIVITINVPYVPDEYNKEVLNFEAGQFGPLMDEALAIQQRVLESFEIKDYSLFVN